MRFWTVKTQLYNSKLGWMLTMNGDLRRCCYIIVLTVWRGLNCQKLRYNLRRVLGTIYVFMLKFGGQIKKCYSEGNKLIIKSVQRMVFLVHDSLWGYKIEIHDKGILSHSKKRPIAGARCRDAQRTVAEVSWRKRTLIMINHVSNRALDLQTWWWRKHVVVYCYVFTSAL